MNEQKINTNDSRFWLGLILVVVGGAWLLDNLDIIPYYISDYILSWKTFLILLGAYFILGRKKVEPGIILIAIGTVFILQDMNIFHVRNILHVFWPAIIIIIGISLIMRRSNSSRPAFDGVNRDSVDHLDDFAIFGGRERTIDSQNFKGGKITAMFGGSDIDFRGANLAPGNNVLDVFVIFGGTEIVVPPDWTVHVEVFSLLGGFSDKRSSALKVVPNPEKVLVIKGFVMFGGGEIKL